MGLFSAIVSFPPFAFLVKSAFNPPGASQVNLFGLTFPNHVGLAAGFDKDGRFIRALKCLGFGFIEVGTVTPRPQSGNPRPRLFRLRASRGLINRMGFNNAGCDALVKRLQRVQRNGTVIGANIGKNKDTPNSRAVVDYLYCFEKLHPFVDYFVVNVSSPNTPNLRELQEKGPLKLILRTIQERNAALAVPRPVLLKIAPDLSESQLDDIVEIALETKLDGLVATNTTISRYGLVEPAKRIEAIGPGGVSGKPIQERALDIVRYLHARSGGMLPIVGVGGIFDESDATQMRKAGASLVQVYTGFIYEGPGIVKRILRSR